MVHCIMGTAVQPLLNRIEGTYYHNYLPCINIVILQEMINKQITR